MLDATAGIQEKWNILDLEEKTMINLKRVKVNAHRNSCYTIKEHIRT